MLQPLPITVTEPSLESFNWVGFGTLSVPGKPMRFGFQIDIVPSALSPEIAFGVVHRDVAKGSFGAGFAVRIDLDRGEIWDLVNNSGLVGWIDHPFGLQAYSVEEPMLLSWEIERIGSVLIPKLQVGGEEWLYPSIRCTESLQFTAVAGCSSEQDHASDWFMHPALWHEEQS
jgi:hypothetical protein